MLSPPSDRRKEWAKALWDPWRHVHQQVMRQMVPEIISDVWLNSGMATHDETDRKVRNILTGPGAAWDQINA